MKKIQDLIRKLKNNAGSGLVLVIVGLAFIGILTGALLTAAGYVYRRTLYDYNARDNFYYVEQAMDEIYAGIGNMTFGCVVDAYNEALENATQYVLGGSEDEGTYKTLSDTEIRDDFNRRYMSNVSALFYEKAISNRADFIDAIKGCITNPSCKLEDDGDNISVILLDATGAQVTPANLNSVKKIVLKNIAVQRTANYTRSQANGSFTQTIRADLIITAPNIDIGVSVSTVDYNNLFKYSVIADNGLDITQFPSSKLVFNGSVYAGNDYYNKEYNNTVKYNTDDERRETSSDDYKINPVLSSSLRYTFGSYDPDNFGPSSSVAQYNKRVGLNTMGFYDGVNLHSKYSGIYIEGSDVTFVSDMLVVPGTIGVMNAGKLQVLGTTGNKVKNAEVWADNVLLGGYSVPAGDGTDKKIGSSATFVGNLYVKDDLTLDADNSDFIMKGSYFGFSDSSIADNRVFTPAVNPDNFYYTYDYDSNNNPLRKSRDHYNSSAIIVNGNEASLDLTKADSLFVAGRAYIELSKKTTFSTTKDSEDNDVETKYYTYNATSDDYKTGDSLAVKSVQVAYFYDGNILNQRGTDGKYIPTTYVNDSDLKYLDCELDLRHQNDPYLFGIYFGDAQGKVTSIPVTEYTTAAGEVRYLINFDVAYRYAKDNNNAIYQRLSAYTTDAAKKDAMVSSFIKDYNEISTDPIYESLGLAKIDDFDENGVAAGEIEIAGDVNSVYTSGAVSEKSINTINDTSTFTISTRSSMNRTDELLNVLGSETSVVSAIATGANANTLSTELNSKYDYVKYSLTETPNPEASVINENILSRSTTELGGSSAITPINTYMNFDKLDRTVLPKDHGYSGATTILLQDKNRHDQDLSVFVSDGYLLVKPLAGKDTINGIIVCSGDVEFDPSVKNFSGLIIAGGKVYIGSTNVISNISANSEVCKTVIRQLYAIAIDSSNPSKADAEYILSLFKGYDSMVADAEAEAALDPDPASDGDADISYGELAYSDVVRFDNWIKEVR